MRRFKFICLIVIVLWGIALVAMPAQVAGATTCDWGNFEVLNISGYSTNICDFINNNVSGNSRLGAMVVLNIAVALVTALVIMTAFVTIVIGGYIYMTAGGSADRVGTAKKWIVSGLLGIIIALSAWIILGAINPYLIVL